MVRRAASIAAACLGIAIAAAGEIPLSERHSTYEDMSAATKAMQDGDTDNPGMLWVLDGEALWQAKAGRAGIACAGPTRGRHRTGPSRPPPKRSYRLRA